ncbi:MAG: AAA family ATPase [Sporichthyaceae bacterium]
MATPLVCPGVDARYRTLRVLSRGEATERRLAVDPGGGRTVVVTLADRGGLSPSARERFDRESARWRELRVPGLAELLDGGCEAGIAYVVSDYATGISLRSALRAGPLGVRDTLQVLSGVLAVLDELHQQGLVHCDLRPSTVILAQKSAVSPVTVVGPGSAWSAVNTWVPGDKSSMVADYLAPEQAGLLDRVVDGRTDLYATGVLAFECLAGRPPLAGETRGRALSRPLSSAFPALRALGVAVPQALEEVLRRLTHTDPEDRYASAAAALADVAAVAAAMADGVAEPDVVVGAHDRRQSLTEPALTGRSAELGVLTRRLEDAREGAGRLMVVEAESGGGKSRLVEEFCQRAAAGGAWVLRGHGVPPGAQLPLQVLAGVAVGVVAEHERDPTLGPRVRRAVGPFAAVLGDLLPVMRKVLADPAAVPTGSPVHVRARAVGALVALLRSLGTPERPAVLALDDCHWADEVSLEALAGWSGDPSDSAHVLIVVALRPQDGAAAREVLAGAGAEPLALGPLSRTQIAQVVESMAGPVPQAALDVVEELSRGNPFMASAVLRGLVEAGALSAVRAGWAFRAVPGGWQASREAAAILGRRLDLIDAHTRTLLCAGAVLGREFDLPLAAQLATQDAGTSGTAIEQALERHLVWEVGASRYAFVHDRLREGLLAELDPAARAALHLGAAEDLQARDPAETFELAYHFDAAGAPARALGFALKSAASARSRHDLELAESLYRIAERGLGSAAQGLEYTVTQALGQILMLRGRYDEALERFERAQTLASDELDLARVQGQLGELLFRRDDLDGAARYIESGLRVLGERIPANTPQVLFQLGQELLRRVRRGMPGAPGAPGEDAAARERERLRAHLYTQLQYPRWFHGNRLETLWLMVRQVNVAEGCPASDELAHSYAVWGGALALTFPFLAPRGMTYVQRSGALYRGHGDLRGMGHAASMRTCVLLAAGRYREGVAAATEAIDLLSQYGDRWEVGFAIRNRALCLYRLGRFAEAAEDGRSVHRIGLEVGDANAEVTALEVLAKATGGQVPVVRTRPTVGAGGADLEVRVAGLQSEALRLRRERQLPAAVAALTEAATAARRALPANTYVVPAFAWLATLHREVAEEPFPVTTRTQRLRIARRSARRAVLVARMYPNDRPHALRELGLVHALTGSLGRARRCLDASESTAIAREAWGEVTETRGARERVGLGADSATQALPGTGEHSGADLPTLGLADRFEALLDVGATLASADSTDAVVDGIAQTALALLRAERCLVVGLGRPIRGDQAPASGAGSRPAVLSEPFSLPDSVLPAGTRSALYAPVLVRGEVVGYFLATHSRVGQLFDAESERLAEFIARLAGAAYERQALHRESRAQALAAQEAERTRIARDLHDEIGQALTSVLLGVRGVEGAAAGPEVPARAAELREVVISALDSVKALAFELRPAVLSDLGLLDALRRLVDNPATGGGAAVELETLGLEAGYRLPAEVETAVYRIVQESLTNVARHAHASHCSVVLGRSLDRLRVVIEDDGVGFELAAPSRAGLGLRGVSERAALVGGSVKLTTTPGSGTSVVLEVPLD